MRGSASGSAAVVGGVGGSCWGPPFIGRRSVWRSGGGLGSADLSAGVAFGALEVVWGAPFIGRRSVWRSGGGLDSADLSAGVAFGALEDSSEGLDLCKDKELSLERVLAYDCL